MPMTTTTAPTTVPVPATIHPAEPQTLLPDLLRGEPLACLTIQCWAEEAISHQYRSLAREDREDLVQDAITQVWKQINARDFQLRIGLRAFVRRIARARAIDRLRHLRVIENVDPQCASTGMRPDELRARNDAHARLRKSLRSLPQLTREPIRLRFFEGLSYDEMALRLDRKPTTLRAGVFYTLRLLQEQLSEES